MNSKIFRAIVSLAVGFAFSRFVLFFLYHINYMWLMLVSDHQLMMCEVAALVVYLKAPWRLFSKGKSKGGFVHGKPSRSNPLSVHEGKDGWIVIHTWTVNKGGMAMTATGWLLAFLATFPLFLAYRIYLSPYSLDRSDPAPMLLIFVACGFIFSAHFNRKLRRGKGIQDGALSVSAQHGIRLSSGKTIPVAQIYAIRTRNTSPQTLVPVNVFSPTTVAANILGQSIAENIRDHSYAVEVEHAGVLTVLAGGLTEPLANAVQSEITRRLPGFKR